jgi:RimJ/RimL family protein N-acetyltransferase
VTEVPSADTPPGSGLPALPPDLGLRTPRLRLVPVTTADADELRALHADPELFRFTGRPRHLDTGLDAWLGDQERRHSPTGAALWLTWLLRPPDGGPALGQVQATVVAGDDGPQAELSWLLARAAQRHGLATEAATAVTQWLVQRLGVRRLSAHIPDGHAASEGVAARLGLIPSGDHLDGEQRWSSTTTSSLSCPSW